MNKGNFKQAINELTNNASTAHLYENKNIKKGDMSGVVVTLKDLYATKDAPTQSSSKMLDGFKPSYDATIVKKLKDAGASIVAKVHLDELALGGTGQYSAYGKIDNPLDSSRIVGGSSSGSIATFTNSIGLAVGSDTGDSVRQPASYKGVYGYKPSYGAISRYGMFPFASSLDTVSYFNHSIEDVIMSSRTLFGKDELDMTSKDVELPINESKKPKTVGILKGVKLLDYQVKAYNDASKKLKKENIEIKEFEISNELLESLGLVYEIISYSEASSNDSNLNGISFGPGAKGKDWNEIMFNARTKLFGFQAHRRFALGAYFLLEENQEDIFVKAQKVRRIIVNKFNKIKEQVDLLMFPAAPIAPKISLGKSDSIVNSYLSYSNLAGSPSLVIPFGKHDGMPFGMVLDGLIYKDKDLLSYSLYIDKILGGKNE